jgi:prepilin peptidase CpaA
MKIPNWISGLLILAFFPAAFMVGLSPMTVLAHVGVAPSPCSSAWVCSPCG